MVVLLAVASSVVTVGAIELLRGARPASRPAGEGEEPSGPVAPLAAREVEPLAPAAQPPALPAGLEDRLAELERRLDALERDRTREPVATSSTGELPAGDELRRQVLDWVAEDSKARARAAELEKESTKRSELEFQARFQAHTFALEHDLARWQEEKFAQLYLEIAERDKAIADSIDLASADPAEVEARYAEFDEWVDQRERELTALVDPALYEEIYGED